MQLPGLARNPIKQRYSLDERLPQHHILHMHPVLCIDCYLIRPRHLKRQVTHARWEKAYKKTNGSAVACANVKGALEMFRK